MSDLAGLQRDEIQVVDYDDRWADAHAAFARKAWPDKFRRREPAYQRWKFRGPERGPVPGLLLAVARDRVVGQLGLIPGRLWRDGEVDPVQWICDVMVDADARRLGIASRLYDAGFARPVVSLGAEPSPVSSLSFEAWGMSRSHVSGIYVLTLQAGPVVATRYPRLRPASRILSAAAAPAVRVLNRRLDRAAASDRAEVCRWTDVVDLVARHEDGLTVAHAVHDEAFLTWRAQGLDGWVREVDAVRTDAGSYALLERDGSRVRVLQWHATDAGEEALALFGRIAYVAGAYGADHVQAYATPLERGPLLAAGFRARRSRVEVVCWPQHALGARDELAFTGYDSDFGL